MQFEPSTSVLSYLAPPPLMHRGQCGKACYGSKAAAERTVKQMRRHGKDQRYRGYLHAYVCKDCRAWHVGHSAYEDE